MKTYKEFITEQKEISKPLKAAIQGYSAVGGSSSSKFPYTFKHGELLKSNIGKNKQITAYRTYAVTEKEWEKLFASGFTEEGNKNKEVGLNSFTTDKKMYRRFIGGSGFSIILKLKIKTYLPIYDDSIYPEEMEVLVNNLEWTPTEEWEMEGSRIYITGKEI